MDPQASITYGSYAFHDNGAALFSRSVKYVGAEQGRALAKQVSWEVQLVLHEESFADIHAKIALLETALSTTEGALVILDEADTQLYSGQVRVSGVDIPKEWRQYRGTITVTFAAEETDLNAAVADATFTPEGGLAISLQNIDGWSEAIRVDRFDLDVANRAQSRHSVNANGRIYADMTISETDRREYLFTQKALIEAASNSRQGELVFGGETRTMRVDSFAATFEGDGSTSLRWSMELHKREFPTSAEAEAEFTVTTSTDQSTGDVIRSLSGEVRAATEDAAETKAEALRDLYSTGMSLLSQKLDSRLVSGVDSGATPTFVRLSFSYEFLDAQVSALDWQISVDTRTDCNTGQNTITYSGSVTANTSATALAKARELGMGKHPLMVSEQETLRYEKRGQGGAERFVRCEFSYQYLDRNACVFAEVTITTSEDTLGARSYSVQGWAAAATESAALSYARTFKDTSRMVVGVSEEGGNHYYDGVTHFQKVTFRYSYLDSRSTQGVQWSEDESTDHEKRETIVTYSGTAYASNKTLARAAARGVIGIGSITQERFADRYQKDGTRTVFSGVDFSVTAKKAYTGANGSGLPAILDAEVSVENDYGVNKAVITPIPYSTPHTQTGVGWLPGMRRCSGQVRGSNSAALLAFAMQQRTAHERGDLDKETVTVSEVREKYSTGNVTEYRVQFNFAWIDATLLSNG